MPYKVFVAGEEALAADANTYLMSQTVPRFTNAAQRTSQLTAPVANQLTMLDDRAGVIQRWSGSAWVDMMGCLVRWQASNPNVVVAAQQDFTVLSFTMPFSGAVVISGQVGCVSGAGATSQSIAMTANPSPASTPVPSASVSGQGPSQPANLYFASFPYSAMWTAVAAGTVLTFKLRVESSAPGVMGSNVNHVQAQALIVPTLF